MCTLRNTALINTTTGNNSDIAGVCKMSEGYMQSLWRTVYYGSSVPPFHSLSFV